APVRRVQRAHRVREARPMIAQGFTADEIRAIAARARLPISNAQVNAIVTQARVYENTAGAAAGLHHLTLNDARSDNFAGAVRADFHYLRRGLPRELGLEVTEFAVDGVAVCSQDFG